jgi:hypothetical protein
MKNIKHADINTVKRAKKSRITVLMLLLPCISAFALDSTSYEYIDRLLTLSKPAEPVFYDDAVIFTAPSSYQKVGIAFAHEDFARIHWFQRLMSPIAETEPFDPKSKTRPPTHQDSGILFFTYVIPEKVQTLEYRLIINGLWTVDPLNPNFRYDKKTGTERSVLKLPDIKRVPASTIGGVSQGNASFAYRADRGHNITLAGDFNNWDPFMYTLEERADGWYTIDLALPPGVWHYVFYYDGERQLDQNNHSTIYYSNGTTASSVEIK